MKYVDGFVLLVPEAKLSEYMDMAESGAKAWKKHGALEYFECVQDDMNPKDVVFTFPAMAKAQPGELVIFSFIVFNSRQHRDEVNAKVMKEMEEEMNKPENKDKPMPFDMKRMAYGGFKVIVEA